MSSGEQDCLSVAIRRVENYRIVSTFISVSFVCFLRRVRRLVCSCACDGESMPVLFNANHKSARVTSSSEIT